MFHVKHLHALLVNPFIYDFSAYSFWSMPLGLLYMGSILRENGIDVTLIDCLRVVEEKRKADGRGPFMKEKAEKPPVLKNLPKTFRRYGMSREALCRELAAIDSPDIILVTSIMTYWYMGVEEVVKILREAYPSTPIIAGGIYPSLCYDHACAHLSQADLVVRNTETERFYRFVEEKHNGALTFTPSPQEIESLPYPCLDLYKTIPFVPLMTSLGCVFRCTYCGTPYMYPRMARRGPENVTTEIRHWQNQGAFRFVLYDDSFLFRSHEFAKPLLRSVAGLPEKIELYNPNAVNGAFIDEEVAMLLKGAGFQEVRLGFETADRDLQKRMGGKIDNEAFERAVRHLKAAGFRKSEIRAYVLTGLPRQRWETVRDTVDYLSALGVTANLAEYTPIPQSTMFARYAKEARYPVEDDPLFQNNALFPFAWEGFGESDLNFLKSYTRQKNGLPDPDSSA